MYCVQVSSPQAAARAPLDVCFAGGAAATALKSCDRDRGSCSGDASSASSPFRPGWLLQRRKMSCGECHPIGQDRARRHSDIRVNVRP